MLAALLPALPTIVLRLIGAYGEKNAAAANVEIQSRQAKADVQRAESGSRINAFMRAFIAIGPALYLFKIFAIDKVICPPLGLACRTDPLSPELWQVVTAVVGFYFLYEGAIGVTRILKR